MVEPVVELLRTMQTNSFFDIDIIGPEDIWSDRLIDQIRFVVGGTAGEVIVDPDFAQHLVNELLWKARRQKCFATR